MAVAGLGEIAGALKGSISKHTGEMLNVFMNSIDDSSLEVSANSIYGLGLLLEGTPQDLSRYIPLESQSDSSQYNAILNKLQRFFSDDAPINAKENAIGCVSRMILRHPHNIPLDLVLPSQSQILTTGPSGNRSGPPVERLRGERTNLQYDHPTLPCAQSHHALAHRPINRPPGKGVNGGRSTSYDSHKTFFIRISQGFKSGIPTVISGAFRVGDAIVAV